MSVAGRSRDTDIDTRVLRVAGRQLSRAGYDAMSLAAIAAEAGTTRQALYRRWATKAELAAAVVAQLADEETGRSSADPFGDLVRELADFQRGVSRTGRLSLVGTMLQDTTDSDVRAQYRARVVAPRRRRIRDILDRATALKMIDADADLEVAVTMATGSWYGRALAGDPPPADWPARTAALIWRAVGGTVPS
ncbi:helix-turn-helix domain-containing protein [Rhodococcus opacus]|uniref:helix-turn-helix domain-containing protein n=1 Tax=Rhodococcus opacus TaxID=37919 RepID=UPI001C446683|nr:TetR/AcrR family transcriptional regulator [Rhodococcus opacus]MBV6755171.1 TetR/AcrR family transcriptional regulator [Rhodococcus opacus]